jgi:hypothetical protein
LHKNTQILADEETKPAKPPPPPRNGMAKVKDLLNYSSPPHIGMGAFTGLFYMGFIILAADTTHGATWSLPALLAYSVYLNDYVPRHKLIAQTLLALREELRQLKGGAEEKEKMQALEEKVRQLEQQMDYAPQQEVIAQAMRTLALQEEARQLKDDSKDKAELQWLREEVRKLKEKK